MAGAGSFPKSTGDTIYQADYNAIQSLIASVKTTYYGVNCTSAQLSGNPIIDHTTLNNLLTDINSCITHQTGSASGLSTKNTGDQIGHTDFNNLYDNANTAYTNRNNVFSSNQLAQVANAATSSNSGTGWNTTLTHVVTVDFSSAATANYFFQTGGYLYATASSSGGTGSQKDNNWASLISGIGNRTYGLTQWNTGGNVIISTLYGSSVYSSNFWRLSVNKTSSSQVVMTMLFDDAAGGNPNFDELVYLNITSAVGYYKSVSSIVGNTPYALTNTTNLTGGGGSPPPPPADGWGPWTIVSPTYGTYTVDTNGTIHSPPGAPSGGNVYVYAGETVSISVTYTNSPVHRFYQMTGRSSLDSSTVLNSYVSDSTAGQNVYLSGSWGARSGDVIEIDTYYRPAGGGSNTNSTVFNIVSWN